MTAGVLVRCPHCGRDVKVPAGDGQRPAGGADLSGRHALDIGEALAAAQRYWGQFAAPALAYGALAGLVGLGFAAGLFVAQPYLSRAAGAFAAYWAAGLVLNVFVLPPLFAGIPYAAARLNRNERWGVADFFAGFSNYGRVVVLHLLLYAALLLFAAPLDLLLGMQAERLPPDSPFRPPVPPFPITQDMVPYLAGAALVGLLGSSYLMLRWSQAALLVLDQRLSVPGALGASWRITNGNVLGLIGLGLLVGLVLLLGAAACGVGLLLAGPWASLGQAAAYLCLTGQLGRARRSLSRPGASPGRDDNPFRDY